MSRAPLDEGVSPSGRGANSGTSSLSYVRELPLLPSRLRSPERREPPLQGVRGDA